MKHYPKDSKGMFEAPAPDAAFDVEEQLEKAQIVLTREVRNLLTASAAGKLSPPHARDLCAYVKLLSELKAAQTADLAGKTDEELLALKGNK
jgi:hypothetical protein